MLQRVINSFSSSFAIKYDQRNCLHSVETLPTLPARIRSKMCDNIHTFNSASYLIKIGNIAQDEFLVWNFERP